MNCYNFRYYCDSPEIDLQTQQPLGCEEAKKFIKVNCYPVANICCDGVLHTGSSVGFQLDVPCKYTNGKKFNIALLLSIFVGFLGADRFYLGYPALGLLKLSTFGFMFLWVLVDIIFIALQVIVGPSDGSNYIIDYYGPVLENVEKNNETHLFRTT
ncbi:hypothetical protein HELRODRAFT_76891 [Helobdella robusta]|uniref:TM2 domain-containing protein n=1 Tax=Helobdella robusta TaxID=6412 RepID=T1G2Q5_HELRO|nr:hypothetical protein HELRODRAFT_76891 [Helobdella robusta]ESO06824.1 hypothetical protein HELRODRAFT_76891 [Helobdella robusta]